MLSELHANPSLGHKKKGSEAMKKPAGHLREMRIEIHRGPSPKREVTGYTVHHHMAPTATSKSQAFMEHETHTQPFSADEHEKMLDHVQEHLDGVQGGGGKESAAAAATEASEEVDS